MAKSKVPVEAQTYAICVAFLQLNEKYGTTLVHIAMNELRKLEMWIPDSDVISYDKLMNFGCYIRDELLTADEMLSNAKNIFLHPQYENSSTYKIGISVSTELGMPSSGMPALEMEMPCLDIIISSDPKNAARPITMRIATGKMLSDEGRLIACSVGRSDEDIYKFLPNPITLRGFRGTTSIKYNDKLESAFNIMYACQSYKWKELPDKEDIICTPILNALKEEIEFQLSTPSKCAFFITNFISVANAYVVGLDSKNKQALFTKIELFYGDSPYANAPTKIISILPKKGKFGPSKTTLSIVFDNNWEVEVTLINSTGKVFPSAFAYTFKLVKTPVFIGISLEL